VRVKCRKPEAEGGMKEEIVWIAGALRFERSPAGKASYGRTEVAVAVRSVDVAEVEPVCTASLPDHYLDEIGFNVVSHAGAYWRPILGRWTAAEGHPDGDRALEILAGRAGDNPLHQAARSQVRQDVYIPDLPQRNDDTPERHALERSVLDAAKGVMLIGGVACRTCHEPTWVVRHVDRHDRYVVMQVDVGEPGRSPDAVWFAADRRADAESFAADLAARQGIRLVGPRGNIEFTGTTQPGFDDVAFAERRLADTYSMRNVMLAVPEPSAELLEAMTARNACESGSTEAANVSLVIRDLIAGAARTPAADVLVRRAMLVAEQMGFMRGRAIMRRDDEAALSEIEDFGRRP